MNRRLFCKVGAALSLAPLAIANLSAQEAEIADGITMHARREFFETFADIRVDCFAFKNKRTAEKGYASFYDWLMTNPEDDPIRKTNTKDLLLEEEQGSFGNRSNSKVWVDFPKEKVQEFSVFLSETRSESGDNVSELLLRVSTLVYVFRYVSHTPNYGWNETQHFVRSDECVVRETYTEEEVRANMPTVGGLWGDNQFADPKMTLDEFKIIGGN